MAASRIWRKTLTGQSSIIAPQIRHTILSGNPVQRRKRRKRRFRLTVAQRRRLLTWALLLLRRLLPRIFPP